MAATRGALMVCIPAVLIALVGQEEIGHEMPSGDDIDSLLAQWAEVLKVRNELSRAAMFSYRLIYRVTVAAPDQHYDANPDHDGSWEQIHEGFFRNLDARLEDLEAKLREKGVTVTRPSGRQG